MMKKESLYPLLALCLLQNACVVAAVHVPEQLINNEIVVQSEEGFFADKSLKFGIYEATNLDRDWVSSSGMSVGAVGQTKARQDYRFTLKKNNQAHYEVECLNILREQHVSIGAGSLVEMRGIFQCELFESKTGIKRAGFIRPLEENPNTASPIDYPEHDWTLKPEHRTSQGGYVHLLPLGFSIRENSEPIALVQSVNTKKIWMRPDLGETQNDIGAAILAGLAFYKPLSTWSNRNLMDEE